MARQAKSWSHQRAFLLVEATLTAVVIAVGIVFISRGIGGSLRTISRLQQADRLLRLTESAFSRLEAEAQQTQHLTTSQGTFEPPDEAYRWRLTIEPMRAQGIPEEALPAFRSVTLTVTRVNTSTPASRLTRIWPSDWLAQ